jgi:hypothetical protein
MPPEPEASLTTGDKVRIAVQGTLLAIPYVGSALERFVFGGLAELRMKRVEHTLAEIAVTLGEKKASLLVSEDFVNLLEDMAPHLARESDENRRQRNAGARYDSAELNIKRCLAERSSNAPRSSEVSRYLNGATE